MLVKKFISDQLDQSITPEKEIADEQRIFRKVIFDYSTRLEENSHTNSTLYNYIITDVLIPFGGYF